MGGGIRNFGTLTINSSTIYENVVTAFCQSGDCSASGGGIFSFGGALTINNSTISDNVASSPGSSSGGGIWASGTAKISNTTLTLNRATVGGALAGTAVLQNTIISDSPWGSNCSGTLTSNGYSLSSDDTCNLNGPGDLNNTDPMLGRLGNYGGPTQTIPLLPGSPAIDAGNPNGCTDGNGHLLNTDQRGKARPDKEDSGGCDMGAFERQSD